MNVINRFFSILECPDCRGELKINSSDLRCLGCKRSFRLEDNILDMLPSRRMLLPKAYKDPNYLRVKNYKTINYMYSNPILRTVQLSGHKSVQKLTELAEFTLDIGCGNGAHYLFFKNKEDLIGLDVDRKRLLDLSQKVPQAPLILADNYSLPFKANSIPQIISIYTMEHMYYLEKALEEIKRVLKKRAKLIISIPAEGGIFWNLGRRFFTQRYFSKKLDVDYVKCIKIEHCNSAGKILQCLKKYFVLEKIVYWPTFIHSINFNLIITVKLSKK